LLASPNQVCVKPGAGTELTLLNICTVTAEGLAKLDAMTPDPFSDRSSLTVSPKLILLAKSLNDPVSWLVCLEKVTEAGLACKMELGIAVPLEKVNFGVTISAADFGLAANENVNVNLVVSIELDELVE